MPHLYFYEVCSGLFQQNNQKRNAPVKNLKYIESNKIS